MTLADLTVEWPDLSKLFVLEINAASNLPKPPTTNNKSTEAAPASTTTNDDLDKIKQTIERLEAEKAAAAEEGEAEPAGTKITCKKAKGKKRNGILREREKAKRAGRSAKKE